MKYLIECNEYQLRLLRSAVELQMRVRLGQGWAITENIVPIGEKDYRDVKDAYDGVLDAILRRVAAKGKYDFSLRDCNAATQEIEGDMWIGLENALGCREGRPALGVYGILKVTKTEE